MAEKPKHKTKEDIVKETLDRQGRSAHVRRDDKVQNFAIGLLSIDEAIKYYFDNVIKPVVETKDGLTKVPVIYGSPERWKSVQRDGYYRDERRKIMTPLIMYRRTNVENRRDLTRNLDANNPIIYQDFYTKYSSRNNYSPFSRLTGEIPEREIHNIIIPNYIKLTYECIVWTDYVEHMNKLIEAINFSDAAYWGEPGKFKFFASINSFSTPVEVADGEDRSVKSNFEIALNGYIITDSIQKTLIQKSQRGISLSKVVFDIKMSDEKVDTFAVMTKTEGEPYVTFTETAGGGSRSSTTQINQLIIDYLDTNNQKIADVIAPTTATWNSVNIMTAPTGIPATTVEDFSFFVNGQYLAHTGIVSFTQVGANVVLVINPAITGYSLESGVDEVVGLGKW